MTSAFTVHLQCPASLQIVFQGVNIEDFSILGCSQIELLLSALAITPLLRGSSSTNVRDNTAVGSS